MAQDDAAVQTLGQRLKRRQPVKRLDEVLCCRARSSDFPGLAVQLDAAARGLEARHALRLQATDDPGENIA